VASPDVPLNFSPLVFGVVRPPSPLMVDMSNLVVEKHTHTQKYGKINQKSRSNFHHLIDTISHYDMCVSHLNIPFGREEKNRRLSQKRSLLTDYTHIFGWDFSRLVPFLGHVTMLLVIRIHHTVLGTTTSWPKLEITVGVRHITSGKVCKHHAGNLEINTPKLHNTTCTYFFLPPPHWPLHL
jgi:hypothetical protein